MSWNLVFVVESAELAIEFMRNFGPHLWGEGLNHPGSATSAARLPGFLGPFSPASMISEDDASGKWG